MVSNAVTKFIKLGRIHSRLTAEIHPPFDYAANKRTIVDLYGDFFPGGEAGFGIATDDGERWDRPTQPQNAPKRRKRGPRKVIRRDRVSRQLMLGLRLHLHYVPASGIIPQVPDIFGGDITVETYIKNNYPEAVDFLGLSPAVSRYFI